MCDADSKEPKTPTLTPHDSARAVCLCHLSIKKDSFVDVNMKGFFFSMSRIAVTDEQHQLKGVKHAAGSRGWGICEEVIVIDI